MRSAALHRAVLTCLCANLRPVITITTPFLKGHKDPPAQFGLRRVVGLTGSRMDERRRSERRRSLLRGRVYFNSGRCSLDCLVHDISYEGARIVFSDPVSIPDAIQLSIPKMKRMMDASVRWRRGVTIGVVFTQL